MPAVEERYDYRDADGMLLYQVERLRRADGKKSFRQRRPDPDRDGQWIYNLDGVSPVLYRLPETIGAVQTHKWVDIPEGEKDVHSLVALDREATTNSGGAGNWRPEFAERLRGAKVVVMGDANAPGRRHMLDIAKSLKGVADKMVAVEPPKPYMDVTELLEAGGTLKDLRPIDLDAYARRYDRQPEPESEPEVRPVLRLVVDKDTGEIIQPHACPGCQELEDQLSGAQKEIRGWRTRYAELARAKEEEAHGDPLWPLAIALFGVWKQATGHTRSLWTFDRFHTIQPMLRKYGMETCERAIAGIAYDCYQRPMRNGRTKYYNDWQTVFKSAGNVEEYANRAPKDWTPSLEIREKPKPKLVKSGQHEESVG